MTMLDRPDTTSIGAVGHTQAAVPVAPESAPEMHACVVPGCDYTSEHAHALGPHYAAHRRRNDPGTPPPSKSATRKASKRSGSKPKKSAPPKPVAGDMIDTVLELLYPTGIPTGHVRDVAAWMEQTERLVKRATS